MKSRAVFIVNIFQKSECPFKKTFHIRFSFSPSVHFINGVGHTSNIKYEHESVRRQRTSGK